MKIHILTENLTYKRGLLCEHGLSLLIESGQGRWLFDSGQTDAFVKNAKAMGVSLDDLDGIVLSHGHYDHCGGMKTLFALAKKEQKELPPVYVRAAGFEKKYAQKGGAVKEEIGIPWAMSECESLRLIREEMCIRDSYISSLKAMKRLGANRTVCADSSLLTLLKEKLGEKNVKVLEKSIEK